MRSVVRVRMIYGVVLLSALGMSPAFGADLPEGGVVTSGTVDMVRQQDGTVLRLQQRSPRAVIDWASFDIGEEARVDVDQPSSNALLMNRVVGDAPSTLAGQLRANGELWLINPNGIELTRTAYVSAAAFLASTLEVSDLPDDPANDVAAGVAPDGSIRPSLVLPRRVNAIGGMDAKPLYIRQPKNRDAAPLRNQGRIEVANGGKIGGPVHGPVGGQVVLLGGPAENAGRIVADKGAIVILGWRSEPSADAINMSGLLRCRQGRGITEADAGGIRLLSDSGGIRVSGVIDADGFEGMGGAVQIKGPRIDASGALIGASGSTGGGRVSLRAEAPDTSVGASSEAFRPPGMATSVPSISASATIIYADARDSGNGGVISLSSPGAIAFSGVARAAASVGANVAPFASIGAASLPEVGRSAGTITMRAGTCLDAQGDWDISALEGGRRGTIHLEGWRLRVADDSASAHAPHDAYHVDEARIEADESMGVGAEPGGAAAGRMAAAEGGAASVGTIRARAICNALERGDVRIVTHPHPRTGAADSLHIVSPIAWHADTALALASPAGVSVQAAVEAHGKAAMLALANEKTTFHHGRFLLSGAQSAVWMGTTRYTMLRNRSDLQGILSGSDGGHYALATPLDFGGEAIAPITSYFGAHFGRLDGLGNTISRLRIAQPELPSAGLFSVLHSGAVLSNLRIKDVHVSGLHNAGVITGQLSDRARLSGIHIDKAVVQCRLGSAGGIVGTARNSEIAASRVNARVMGHTGVGGVTGLMFPGASVSTVQATGSVTGHDDVGGLVGVLDAHSLLRDSHWAGHVHMGAEGRETIGGMIGRSAGGRISLSSACCMMNDSANDVAND